MGAIDQIRQIVLTTLAVAQDAHWAIDSLPVPVITFHLAPQRTRDRDAHGATYGHCAAKQQMFFGYRLQLVVTLGGVMLDFALTAANADEREVALDLLPKLQGRSIVGDKGYVSTPVATELRTHGVR